MKGEFRNGRFVDEERQQEFRNIQYDLDPEKMERIWVGIYRKLFRDSVVLNISQFSEEVQDEMGQAGRDREGEDSAAEENRVQTKDGFEEGENVQKPYVERGEGRVYVQNQVIVFVTLNERYSTSGFQVTQT